MMLVETRKKITFFVLLSAIILTSNVHAKEVENKTKTIQEIFSSKTTENIIDYMKVWGGASLAAVHTLSGLTCFFNIFTSRNPFFLISSGANIGVAFLGVALYREGLKHLRECKNEEKNVHQEV